MPAQSGWIGSNQLATPPSEELLRKGCGKWGCATAFLYPCRKISNTAWVSAVATACQKYSGRDRDRPNLPQVHSRLEGPWHPVPQVISRPARDEGIALQEAISASTEENGAGELLIVETSSYSVLCRDDLWL